MHTMFVQHHFHIWLLDNMTATFRKYTNQRFDWHDKLRVALVKEVIKLDKSFKPKSVALHEGTSNNLDISKQNINIGKHCTFFLFVFTVLGTTTTTDASTAVPTSTESFTTTTAPSK